MPSSVVAKNPAGARCVFTEEDHRYTWGDENDPTDAVVHELISVSTLVHQFAPPFDAEKVAQSIAARTGEDPAAIVAKWDRNRDEACVRGTRTHETAEDCLLGRAPRHKPADEEERRRFSAVWRFASGIKEKFNVLGVEKLVFSPTLGVAGTIDLLLERAGTVYIMDWKTNKDLSKAPSGTYEPPFSHLPNSALSAYALQLSMYRILLEVEDYTIIKKFGAGQLLWVHPKDEGDEWEVSPFAVPDMGREAAMMIALRSRTKWYADWQKRMPF